MSCEGTPGIPRMVEWLCSTTAHKLLTPQQSLERGAHLHWGCQGLIKPAVTH